MLRLKDIEVRHAMVGEVFTLPAQLPAREAASRLLGRRVGGAPVVAGDELRGVIALSHLLRAEVEGDPLTGPVGELAKPAVTCSPDTTVVEACQRMVRERVHRLVVLERGRVVGLFTAIDAARILACLEERTLAWDPETQTIQPSEA